MSEPQWLSEAEQESWRALVSVLTLLPPNLDRQLSEAGIGHTYYQILAMLSEAEGQTLRASALARITNTSLSRLSHALNRLAERGWIERKPCAEDRRGALISLSPEGLAALEEAAPGHVAQVRKSVFTGLSEQQVAALGEIMGHIATNLEEQRGSGPCSE